MQHKSIDFVALFSGIISALSVVGLVALIFGPWAQPSTTTARTILTISWLTFSMIAALASSAGTLFQEQADQITALQRQIAELHPAA